MNYLLMKMTEESPGRCPSDCSGHGSCVRGACVCERYLPDSLGVNLFNAYYPLIISGFSVIICFWAEVHLSNIFFGFFVALMFLVLTFFLIYGVEIFYKVRGAFITRDTQPSNVDAIQATISRFGLFSQASLQLVTSLLLLGDIIGHKWKDSLPIEGRNALEIIFRVFELGVALWFPCCLWDWKSPSKLWILNPTRLLVHGGNEERRHLMDPSRPYNCYKSITPSETPEGEK
ncbi:hypothetical protein P5673_022896 [Acropora cervicornis]|uniref:Uncharacterized protein n=1 Tax=Acropora cervicornis TaxID=6130 RepID=A0AAD9Q6E9_ACRCE|nr:hypothetical protein P5673_022896 [Acropora cervicornis]